MFEAVNSTSLYFLYIYIKNAAFVVGKMQFNFLQCSMFRLRDHKQHQNKPRTQRSLKNVQESRIIFKKIEPKNTNDAIKTNDTRKR